MQLYRSTSHKSEQIADDRWCGAGPIVGGGSGDPWRIERLHVYFATVGGDWFRMFVSWQDFLLAAEAIKSATPNLSIAPDFTGEITKVSARANRVIGRLIDDWLVPHGDGVDLAFRSIDERTANARYVLTIPRDRVERIVRAAVYVTSHDDFAALASRMWLRAAA